MKIVDPFSEANPLVQWGLNRGLSLGQSLDRAACIIRLRMNVAKRLRKLHRVDRAPTLRDTRPTIPGPGLPDFQADNAWRYIYR